MSVKAADRRADRAEASRRGLGSHGMTWIAPILERNELPYVADERRRLDSWLDFHRATLLSKCAGLNGEQLVQRPVATSTLSLLGLVRHMAANERIWFRIRFAGEDVEGLYESPDYADGA